MLNPSLVRLTSTLLTTRTYIMALKNAPMFEEMNDVEVEQADQDAAIQENTVTTVTVASTASTALAKSAQGIMRNVFMDVQNAFPVTFSSPPSVQASQGSFSLRDGPDMGDEITMELISWQDAWTVGPNDTQADKELVRYADNPVTASDGTNLDAHLKDLLAQGYKKAKKAHRRILVGELTGAKGDKSKIGSLIQINLPDTGRIAFDDYQMQGSFAVKKGRKTAEEVLMIKLEAIKAKTQKGEIYTRVAVSQA